MRERGAARLDDGLAPGERPRQRYWLLLAAARWLGNSSWSLVARVTLRRRNTCYRRLEDRTACKCKVTVGRHQPPIQSTPTRLKGKAVISALSRRSLLLNTNSGNTRIETHAFAHSFAMDLSISCPGTLCNSHAAQHREPVKIFSARVSAANRTSTCASETPRRLACRATAWP